MNLIRKIRKYISSCRWVVPITTQWPLFISYIVLIGWSSITQNIYARAFVIYLHAYIATAIVTWSKRSWVKVLIYVLAFILFFINASLKVNYDLEISPSVLMLLAETNAEESSEFLHSLLHTSTAWVIPALTVVFVVLVVIAEKKRTKGTLYLERKRPFRILSVVSGIMLTVGVIGSYCYIGLFQCKNPDDVSVWNLHMSYPSDALTRVVVALYDSHLAKKEMEETALLAENVKSTKSDVEPRDSLNIVFVIGESYIKDHASVYGYGLNTTPFLLHEKKAGRLVAFTNAVSPYNFTTKVMRNLISTNSLEDGVRWSERPPLTAVFKRAGYFVSMYDNQRTFAFGATFTFALNSYLYAPRVLKVCYDRTNNNSFEYDGQLVDRYKRDFQEQHSHALTIFHLMGQHIEAVKRYPADRQFNHFSADSIKRKEPWITEEMRRGIAEYDNATLYNDYVMKQIISRYTHRNAVVIYVSDHGEEEYDYRPSAGRKGSDDLKNMLYYQYSVPMIAWFSDVFKKKYPNKVQQIKASVSKPFMTDDICQMLFDLGGLTSSPYYSAKHDILSKDYVCGKRIVNDKYNYDNIVRP